MLVGIFVLLLGFTLHAMRALVVPILVAIFLNNLLSPSIARLRRRGVPVVMGALIVLGLMLGPLALTAYALAEPADAWSARLPQLLGKLEKALRPIREPVQKVTAATEQVEKMTTMSDARKQVELREETLLDKIVDQASTLFTEGAIVIVLLFFLLISPDVLTEKLRRIIRDEHDAARAVAIITRIELEISAYLRTLTAINIVDGVVIGLAMWLLGMPNPALWGVLCAALRFIPYVGTLISVGILTAVAIASSSQADRMFLVPAAFLVITSIEGNFISPFLMGRKLKLSPVVILCAVLLFGWMWGIPGAVLAVPILVSIKALSENVTSLRPVAELIGTP